MSTPEKLPGKQLRHLRALAHDLKPTVQIGKGGFSDAVRAQIDQALSDHELIKVKVGSEAPLDVEELSALSSAALGAHVAQMVGATLVLYRKHPKKPKITLPRVP